MQIIKFLAATVVLCFFFTIPYTLIHYAMQNLLNAPGFLTEALSIVAGLAGGFFMFNKAFKWMTPKAKQ